MDNRCLFRGKDCNGKWIIGNLIQQAFDGVYRHEVGIAPLGCYPIGVELATVGQCTGLSAVKSYRGNKPEDLLIWENDRCRFTNTSGTEHAFAMVVFHNGRLQFKLEGCEAFESPYRDIHGWRNIEIISTIHE